MPPGRPATSPTGTVEESVSAVTAASFLSGLRIAILTIAVVALTFLNLPQAVAYAGVYRPAAVEFGSYLVLYAVAGCCALRILHDRPLRGWHRPLLGLAFVAAIAANAAVPAPYLSGPAHGTYGIFGWFAVLLLLESDFPALVAVLAAFQAVTVAQIVLAGQADRHTLVGLAMKGAVDVTGQIVAGYAALALRRIAQTAVHAAVAAEAGQTDQVIRQCLHEDRQARYAALAETVVPLLTGLASDRLDPADPVVQRACAMEAARLRRLFAESDDAPDPLVHELQACIAVADRRGAAVTLALRGRRPQLPTAVRRALTDPAMAVLAVAESVARVTVDGSDEQVTVSVLADSAPQHLDSGPRTWPGGDTTVSLLKWEAQLWVEATWTRRR